MGTRSVSDKDIPEKTGYRYRALLTKIEPSGAAPVVPADLASLTLTLYALDETLTIINGLNAVNILNVGRGSLDANGELIVVLGLLDTAILDQTQLMEKRVMLIQGVDISGSQATRHEVILTIRQLEKVS